MAIVVLLFLISKDLFRGRKQVVKDNHAVIAFPNILFLFQKQNTHFNLLLSKLPTVEKNGYLQVSRYIKYLPKPCKDIPISRVVLK